jgi:glycosyltransferase involved in cell wall biosynthesis
LIAYFLKDMLDSKLVITAHGYDVYDLPFRSNYLKKLSKRVLEKSDKTITVSTNNAHILENINFKNVTIIPNGFDPKLFYIMDTAKCRSLLKLPESHKIILTVGSLTKVKGHKYLLEAFEKVIAEIKNAYLVIIGYGDLKDELTLYCEVNGIQDRVLFAGWIPHEKIALWMNACDIFVLSSLAEGNPIVMFEALGCGKPFIGTNVGGIPEIIKDDRLGFIVKSANSSELSAALINALMKNWDKDYILSCSKQYTWRNIAKETMAIYNGILEN